MFNILIKVLGNRAIKSYSSSDASKFRDWLIEQGMSLSTVKRVFSSVKAVINLTIQEYGLDFNNPFAKIYMPEMKINNIEKVFLLRLLDISNHYVENMMTI